MNEATDAEEKARVRAVLRAQRRALHGEDVRARGAAVQARALLLPELRTARTLALYAALPGEVPTDALLAAALAQGKTVVFPVVPHAGRCLAFRAVDSPSQLRPAGPLHIREPEEGRPAVPLSAIDVFVVPGLGFTRAGSRLGQGAGYYDATLSGASSRSRRVGLAFSEQVLRSLPSGPGDVPMHWVVTEADTFGAPDALATVLGPGQQ